MSKQELLEALKKRLSGLPLEDVEERLNFYSEMIDDRIEEGETEEDAVAGIGAVDDIARQIIADIPLARIARERIKPKRRLGALEIVLLVLGAPLWLSLLIAAFAVVLSLYAAVWSLTVSLWAAFASVTSCAVGGVAAGAVFAATGHGVVGIATAGAGIFLAGLAIFLFFLCKWGTRGTARLGGRLALGVKKCFMGGGTNDA